MNPFDKEQILLFDGAYGTNYHNDEISSPEMANLLDRQSIFNLHADYIKSGAMAIKTNTYGANSYRLSCDENKLKEVIRAGCVIAQEAAGDNVRVFADIGPVMDEKGEIDILQYKKICGWFLSCGIDDFLFETNAEETVFLELIPWLRKQADVFTITSFAIDPMGYTKKGNYYKEIIKVMRDISDAYGFNCLSGPTHLLRLISDTEIGDDLVSIMPNAGYPANVGGRMIYNDNPEYFAQKSVEMKKAGVRILGGCCGTTPKHIEKLARLLKVNSIGQVTVTESHKPLQKNLQIENPLKNKLLAGEKVIACELHSPLELNIQDVLDRAKILKETGADLITIADSPLARARADSFMIASKIKREIHIDVIPHLTCRDRNNIAIRGTLLGGQIENLRNILVLTGDPISSENEEKSKSVFNNNSYQLIHYIESLNELIFNSQPYFIGCGANPNTLSFENELSRCIKKEQCGAKFCLTQPVYSNNGMQNVLRIKKETGLYVLAGIMPVASYKNALFLKNEVPGIEIPEEMLEAYRDLNKDEAAKISEEICFKIIDELQNEVDGFYFICPLNKTEVVTYLIQKIKN